MSEKWLITREIGAGATGGLLGTLGSAGDFQEVKGTLLYRGGGSDHPAGLLAHPNGVEGYGAEIL